MEAIDPLEELLKEALAEAQERQRWRDNPYVADLIEVLLPHGASGWWRTKVIDEMETIRRRKRLPVPQTFEQTVQSAFNHHCTNSAVFKRRNVPEDGLFYSKRHGKYTIWVVHTNLTELALRIPDGHPLEAEWLSTEGEHQSWKII